jgi:hypothetical protein
MIDVLFFANDSRNVFFAVIRLKLIIIKNLPIYPCKKYLLGAVLIGKNFGQEILH